jgi:battenin
MQAGILGILAAESAFGIFGDTLEHYSFAVTLIFVLISIEGICGGLA